MTSRGRLLALAGGSCLVSLAMAETAFRIFGIGVLHRPRMIVGQDGKTAEWCCIGELIADPDGLYRFQPGAHFKYCYDGNPHGEFDGDNCVSYSINAHGFRDVEYEPAKPSDIHRIAVLGDSFTVGEGVPFERTYTQRLAQALHGRTVHAKKIQVLNLGVSGENTDGMITYYYRTAPRLEPDLVILQWNTNDFPSSALARDHLRLVGMKYRDSFQPPTIFAWSRLASLAWRQVRLRSIAREIVALTEDDLERGISNFTKILLLNNLVRSRGQEFAVLVFPEIVRLGDYPYANLLSRLEAYLKANGIPSIDLLADLARHRDRDLWVHETDHHPNGLAHQIAADALRRYLEKYLDSNHGSPSHH